MRLSIKDPNGKFRGAWVAKTIRGLSQKQKKEIAKVRTEIQKEFPTQ